MREPPLERLRVALRSRLPAPAVRIIAALLWPQRYVVSGATRWMRTRDVLPSQLRGEYWRMWRDARARWYAEERCPTGPDVLLPLDRSGHRVWLRPGTSDILLYRQVIIERQYDRLTLPGVRTIVDCGANIGLVSAYLLCKYPEARVVAIEPDPVNHALCLRNLEQFGERATVVRAALWGRPTTLAVVQSPQRGTWASTVAPRDGAGGTEAVEGLDVPGLLARFGLGTVDLLKIDIEGAETEVFAAPDLSWLDHVRCIAIEVEPRNEALFRRALSDKPFVLLPKRGDVTVAVRAG